MSNSANDRKQFEKLLAGCLGDGLTDDQNNQFDRLLQRNPEFVSEYVLQMNLDAMLESELNDSGREVLLESLVAKAVSSSHVCQNVGDPADSRRSGERGYREKVLRTCSGLLRSSPILTSAAVLLVMVGAGVLWWSNDRTEILPLSPANVAVLLDSEDVEWSNRSEGIAFGTRFSAGEVIALKSGIVRIGFDCGAGVVLQGPAELEIQSKLAACLRFGRLSAVVPEEARGFTVESSEVRIIDYGTRFGAVVEKGGGAEVHVFEGEVDVEPAFRSVSRRTRLHASEARRFNAPDVVVIPTEPEDFAEVPTLEQLVAGRLATYPSQSMQAPLSHSANVQSVTRLNPHDDPLPQDILVGESFAYDTSQWRTQVGGIGFKKAVWEADKVFTRLVILTKPLRWGKIDGGRRAVLLHGRDRAWPAIANRIVRRLAKPIDGDVYFSFLGRYNGLDDDDFFVLWFDNNNSFDASHGLTPNVGILRGDYIARFRVYTKHDKFAVRNQSHTVHRTTPVDGDTFFLVARLFKQDASHYDRLALWINPQGGEEQQPDLVAKFDGESKPISSFQYVGVRMGAKTEVSDELLFDRLVIGDSYEQVTEPSR